MVRHQVGDAVTFLTVGNPIKLSDSATEVKTSPLPGARTDQILKMIIGCGDTVIEAARTDGAICHDASVTASVTA